MSIDKGSATIAYHYQSTTSFDYYYFGGIVLTIQEYDTRYPDRDAYAKISSSPSKDERDFWALPSKTTWAKEITAEEFKLKLQRAFEIISEIANRHQ